MNWWDVINPFTNLGNAAAGVVADGWTMGMLGLWNAGLWLLKLVLGIEDFFLTPDLSERGPMRGVYPYTFWVAGALVLMLLMIQLGVAAFRRDGESLARVLIGAGQFVMVWVAWVGYAVVVLAAASGLTRGLMTSLLHVDSMDAWQPWSAFDVADITDGTMATVLGLLGLFLVFAAIGHLLVMLARGASLLVLSATAPISAAGLVWEGGRSWFWKSFRWFHAAAFTPVVMMLMLGLGVQITSSIALGAADSVEKAIGTAVPAVMLLLVGCFAPLALFKLLAFVDPGTSSGAGMRAGLAAQGGISGLLAGGDAGGSSAASSSDAGGRSQGEAGAEAATTSRVASAAGKVLGPVGTGLGVAVGAGAAAATIGADMTNQMGVGHNTYIPDFGGGSRSKGRNNGGPSNADQNNPEINGAGDQGGAAPTIPTPPAPAMPTAPMPAAAGPAGDGAAAAGGGAAAAGGAAAVPIVPV